MITARPLVLSLLVLAVGVISRPADAYARTDRAPDIPIVDDRPAVEATLPHGMGAANVSKVTAAGAARPGPLYIVDGANKPPHGLLGALRVPEPSSLTVLGLAVAFMASQRRKRGRKPPER